ncbi:ABC transporter ATP-binding protein [Arabiibacter massiliensis]|uniref:ABC transporter ATP-binding protein n=1 Tax=Arabiibacter massiliensis TaxID=1870985 RepID=UPI0009B97F08|nr:ABC transporter ATP-binding protein [Arabiibacter massiliensis]
MKVEVKGLVKTIKGATVLDGIDLALEGGRVYGLRGKNGSGKTMLMRAMAGLIRPTAGEVVIDGHPLAPGEFPPSVGIMIENPAFIGKYTGFRNLKYLAGIRNEIDDAKIERTLEEVGLDPHDRRTYKKYSLGMKQRLGIACAVMEDPDLLLLDEPINALDPAGVEMVQRLVARQKERGALVVVACHDAEELDDLADVIYLMAEGRIVGCEDGGGDAA